MLGLPDRVIACLFDLDGVLTDTASVHGDAWKQTFGPLLKARNLSEFTDADYVDYVDGKPRSDGVRDFLASRDIHLPEGSADDQADADTVLGVGNSTNSILLKAVHVGGARVFEDARTYFEAARDAGLRRLVVSSSANTNEVLHATGIEDLVEGRVDGVTIGELHLRGKPAPDSFLAGAKSRRGAAVRRRGLRGRARRCAGGTRRRLRLCRRGQPARRRARTATGRARRLDCCPRPDGATVRGLL